MQILETHALSEKEAVELTIKYLNVEPDQIQIKVHKKGGAGFLGFGEKKPNTYYVFAIEGKTPRDVVIRGVLSTILHKMGYKAKVIEIKEVENGKIYTELASPMAAYLIGRKGKTLEALQNMTNLLLERFFAKPSKVILDIEDYRDRREKNLISLAERMAEQVERTGSSKMLDSMNPYERRIIHSALEANERVTTQSVGTGNYKKVCIKPKSTGSLDPQTAEPSEYPEQEEAIPHEIYANEDKDSSRPPSDDDTMPSFDELDDPTDDGEEPAQEPEQPDDYR